MNCVFWNRHFELFKAIKKKINMLSEMETFCILIIIIIIMVIFKCYFSGELIALT